MSHQLDINQCTCTLCRDVARQDALNQQFSIDLMLHRSSQSSLGPTDWSKPLGPRPRPNRNVGPVQSRPRLSIPARNFGKILLPPPSRCGLSSYSSGLVTASFLPFRPSSLPSNEYTCIDVLPSSVALW